MATSDFVQYSNIPSTTRDTEYHVLLECDIVGRPMGPVDLNKTRDGEEVVFSMSQRNFSSVLFELEVGYSE